MVDPWYPALPQAASAAGFRWTTGSTGEPWDMSGSAWPPGTAQVIKPTPSRGGVQPALLSQLVASPAAPAPAAEAQSSSSSGRAAAVPAATQSLAAKQSQGRPPGHVAAEKMGKAGSPADSLLKYSGHIDSLSKQGRLAPKVRTPQQLPTSYFLPGDPGWDTPRHKEGVAQGSQALQAPLPFAASAPGLGPGAPAAHKPSQPAWCLWSSNPHRNGSARQQGAAAGSRLPVEGGASGSASPGQLPLRGNVGGSALQRWLPLEQPGQCSGAVAQLSGLPLCRSSPAAFTLSPTATRIVAKESGSLQASTPPCPVAAASARSLPTRMRWPTAVQGRYPQQQGQQQFAQHDRHQQATLLPLLPSMPSSDQSGDTWLPHPAAALQPAAPTGTGVSAWQQRPGSVATSREPSALGIPAQQAGASQPRQHQQRPLLPQEQADSDLTAMEQRFQLLQAYAAGARAARQVRVQQGERAPEAQRAQQAEPVQRLWELLLQQRAWQRARSNSQSL
ncbi:hypothetical protein N2152v2_003906 [Parachlorella kessleri]